jgi:hypothetical protein
MARGLKKETRKTKYEKALDSTKFGQHQHFDCADNNTASGGSNDSETDDCRQRTTGAALVSLPSRRVLDLRSPEDADAAAADVPLTSK